MMNFLKNNLFYLILFILLIYKGVFVNFISNVNLLFTKQNNNYVTEINMLNDKVKELSSSLEEVTNLKTVSLDYKLTRLSYRLSYSDYNFYIEGDDYAKNDLLVNQDGLVGIIKDIKKDYSECMLLPGINNLSIKINEAYGTIKEYENGLFISEDISNYDDIKVNDQVYTSVIGDIKVPVLVGTVYSIEEHDIYKKIYIKSNVDFHNINYLYVVS